MKTITVTCSCTITLKVDEGQNIQDVLADLDCTIQRGELTSYDVEDSLIHLDQADIQDSR